MYSWKSFRNDFKLSMPMEIKWSNQVSILKLQETLERWYKIKSMKESRN